MPSLFISCRPGCSGKDANSCRATAGMSLRRRLGLVAAAGGGVAAAAVAIERSPSALDPHSAAGVAAARIAGAVRFGRAFGTASLVMADYRMLFARHTDYAGQVYKGARSVVHVRSAERLLKLCRTQGAVYVKVGQHVASMSHAVPDEYLSRMKLLEDKAAHRPWWQIKGVLQRELGAPLSKLFSEFDEQPVAAASLAQVHRARLRDSGEVVAVKVQYPGLETLVAGDIASIQALSWLLSFVFPYFSLDFIVDQFRANLDKEIDFQLEGESGMRTASFFANDARITVPTVHENFSTPRVLTMDFIEGFRVDDLDALRAARIDPGAVAQAVVDAFAQMIFVNGFVHCDGHAGNLMIRPGKRGDGDFELVLLDHGLYRELDDCFRKAYCRLWRGLVLRRTKEVDEACAALGAPGFANVFSIFLLNRSWSSARNLRTDIRNKMNRTELHELRDELRASGVTSGSDMSSLLANVPDELLLVFKMNSLVRNVNAALGASVNRFKVNARYAVRGIWHTNGPPPTRVVAGTPREVHELRMSWWARLGRSMDILAVEASLLAIDAVLLVVRWWFGAGAERKLIG